jgi:hypothetical protein
VSANYLGRESGGFSKRDCFSKVTRSDNYLVIASEEFIGERAKEGYVRRVCQIDPDSHWQIGTRTNPD